ncbi:MAG: aminotransferase class V-fold PLP-dependent enzyme [Taibaiella sp.]|nr:aminotransferase class V-fold PLP-dependent enzyme [Taibaiella sp.]
MSSIYLNTASCGLISPESLAAGNELYAAFADNASGVSEVWRMNEESRIRGVIADFIGAPTANVAMVPNFSWAMNAIVQSLKGNERVLLYKHDYPSLLEPFRINNFDITWVDAPDGFNIDVPAIEKAITSNAIDIVAISHVQWTSGYKLDLEYIGNLCREKGVLFIVDGTQSLGACTINLSQLPVDVFAASHYKWMNAGFGNGTLYLTDAFMSRYQPVVGGHNSYKMREGNWGYEPSVISYEPGSPNMFGLNIVAHAIAEKNRTGLPEIARHNLSLMQLFLQELGDAPVQLLGDRTMQNRSPIVLMKDENGLGEHIHTSGFVVTRRNGMLRVSTHFYNKEDEVTALAGCIRTFYR